MSEKNYDRKGRWRNITIAFRVSPEENEEINRRVALSGLTKQEYISQRCQEKDVIVVGNPRVHKALKSQMESIHQELCRLECGNVPSEDLQETIRLVAQTFGGMIDIPSSRCHALQTLAKKGKE